MRTRIRLGPGERTGRDDRAARPPATMPVGRPPRPGYGDDLVAGIRTDTLPARGRRMPTPSRAEAQWLSVGITT